MKGKSKILNRKRFLDTIREWQNSGLKVVFTNGCFDILHPGHIDFLEKARDLGDKLAMGLNTDDSVSRIKGKDRPINNEDHRSKMLAALESVDLITFFDSDTPLDLIKESKPDILVKGSDYTINEIVGATEVLGMGGKVKTISLLPGYSTTGLIQNIVNKARSEKTFK